MTNVSRSTPSETSEEEILDKINIIVQEETYACTCGCESVRGTRDVGPKVMKYLRSKGLINNG